MVDGVSAIIEVPPDRWDVDAFYDPRPAIPGKSVSRYGGFLEGVDLFDPYFFGISPREAHQIDPQQRLLLEVAWEASEDAGLPMEQIADRRTGVFLGVCTQDYTQLQLTDITKNNVYITVGEGRAAAGRMAQVFGLRGPTVVLDTACSSSLVAIHLACTALQNNECDLAFAGGVNLTLKPDSGVSISQVGLLSPDGRCRSFDASAQGFVRAEGVAVALLKPLSKALADRDPIYAVIRGSATNNDANQSSFMTPSKEGQIDVLQEAYRRGGVSPAQVQYVEAHGTSTPKGDPVEAAALGAVLSEGRARDRPCRIGSAKTNIGHTEAAAGVAGLIKAALSLKHQTIPATRNFETPNPEIPWEEIALTVQTETIPWPEGDGPRLAGVSSFGVTGTNAHVVLEEAPAPEPAAEHVSRASSTEILPLSAQTEDALQALAELYREQLTDLGNESGSLRDICYTASVRRSHHDHRLALVAESSKQFAGQLDSYRQGEPVPGIATGRKVAQRDGDPIFLFSGVGSQWASMGRTLRGEEPIFRETLEQCQELIRKHAGWSLLEEIDREQDTSLLNRIDIMQPAIFSVQAALAALWKSWGVVPGGIVGHSLGECAAAHVAGAITLEEAIRIVCLRGGLMRRKAGQGAMIAVELTPDEARKLIAGRDGLVSLAAWNSAASTVLSGDPEQLADISAQLEAKDVFCRRLKVDVASHSPQMDTLLSEIETSLADLKPRPETVPIYSTVNGVRASGTEFDARYWARNLRDPVLFAPVMKELLVQGHRTFVEVSPHPVLLPPVRLIAQQGSQQVTAVPSLKRDQDGRAIALESLGSLYVSGFDVDWRKQYRAGGKVISLPAYPWQRDRFWMEDSPGGKAGVSRNRASRGGQHPFLENHWQSADNPDVRYWEAVLDTVKFSFLKDHLLQGVPLLPAVVYIEMALAASIEAFGAGPRVLRNFQVLTPIFFPSEESQVTIQVVMSPDGADTSALQFYSRESRAGQENGDWVPCARGSLQHGNVKFDSEPTTLFSEEALQAQYSERDAGASFYAQTDFGSMFHGVEQYWHTKGGDHVVSTIQLSKGLVADASEYSVHPVQLDCMIHMDMLRRSCQGLARVGEEVLGGIEELQIRELPRPDRRYWCLARALAPDGDVPRGEITVFDEQGRIVLKDHGHRISFIDSGKQKESRSATEHWLYEWSWEAKERRDTTSVGGTQWLILGDRGGFGQRISNLLEEVGDSCLLVASADLESEKQDSLDQQIREFLAVETNPPPARGVIHLWSLDAPASSELSLASLASTQEQVCGSVLRLVQLLGRDEGASVPRLWLVTRGAQAVEGQGVPVSLAQSPLLGLAWTISSEHPNLQTTRIDLDPSPHPEDGSRFVAELGAEDPDREIALRGDERYVARLSRWEAVAPEPRAVRISSAQGRSYTLRSSGQSLLDNLLLCEVPRRHPGPGEIEIQVSVAGLNFLDVLKALDMAPGLPVGSLRFGMECCGRIVRVGEGVTGLKVGDAVLAMADGDLGCLSAFLTQSAQSVLRMPDHLTMEEAVTIPVAYMTAHYGLRHLARLREGESVLIHSAAGGVGLAALEVARRAGAEVFATAGSPEKREYLRKLGVRCVMDSRTLDFADEIMEQTGGRGVDVVLNSLAGEAIPKSLSVLATAGRFVELGKTDIYADTKLGLLPFQKNLSLFAVDLLRLNLERPDLYAEVWSDVVHLLQQGVLQPLPHTLFPVNKVSEAFHFMAQGKHIGKIVIGFDNCEVEAVEHVDDSPAVRDDKTYLITGGLGGLGLSVAHWLVDQGARHLALMGRRGASAKVQPAVDSLRDAGAEVRVFRADVSSPEDVASTLGEIRETMPPLAGVVHCAGVLGNGVLQHLDRSQFAPVFAPKIDGSWNLHTQLLDAPLDFFVLFSSIASTIGSAGQGCYAAANAFLDSLAHYRKALGLPALSINWGPWSEVGLAAQMDLANRIEGMGMESMSPEQGVRVFGDLLVQSSTQVLAVDMDWKDWRRVHPEILEMPAFARLAHEMATASGNGSDPIQASSVVASVLDAENADEGRRVLLSYLGKEIGKLLRIPKAMMDPDVSLTRFGLDSLMAVELRNRIEFDLSLSVPVVQFLKGPTARELAESLYGEIEKAAATVDGLSDEEVDGILDAVASNGASLPVTKSDARPTTTDELARTQA